MLFALPLILKGFGRALGPNVINLKLQYQPPSRTHLFGTDALGRPLLARTLLGTGLSLEVAARALAIAFVLAIVLGAIAGNTKGRWPDLAISWMIALLHTIPFVLIAIAVAAVLLPGLTSISIVIGIVAWAAPARIVRAEVMVLRSARFVAAQRAFGFHPVTIFFRSVLPLCVVPPLASLLYLLPELIGIDVGLSFFGLGAQPPIPTVGRLVYDGLNLFQNGWWLAVAPASLLLLFFLILYACLAGSKIARQYRAYGF
jgi:peptide/nickel transport system permease protein